LKNKFAHSSPRFNTSTRSAEPVMYTVQELICFRNCVSVVQQPLHKSTHSVLMWIFSRVCGIFSNLIIYYRYC